jgi:hypothetical protein
MKGWIEVTKKSTGKAEIYNLRHIVSIDVESCLWFDNESNSTQVKETYDELKQLIKEAE